jgi:hypothetical protein
MSAVISDTVRFLKKVGRATDSTARLTEKSTNVRLCGRDAMIGVSSSGVAEIGPTQRTLRRLVVVMIVRIKGSAAASIPQFSI